MKVFLTKDSLLPTLVFMVGVVATWVTWLVFDWQINQTEQLRFTRYSDRIISTIKERWIDHERLLEGGRGLFYSSKAVDFDEWRTYVSSQNLDLFPGILGVGYIYPVQRENLADFLAEIRKQAPVFSVKSTGQFPELFVITQIEPVANNYPAWGLDIGQEANRREAAENARETGVATLTRNITLVQDQKKIAGFLMLLPMYRTKQIPITSVDRLREFVGWVYVPIRIEELMQGIVSIAENMLDFEVIDGDGLNKPDLIFDADGHLAETPETQILDRHFKSRKFHKKTLITTQGRAWTIITSSRPEFERTAAHAHWVMPVGILLSLMTSLAMWSLVNARRRAQTLADLMTLEVRERETRLHAIVEGVMDAIIVIDGTGRVESFNSAAERMFGLSAQETIGQNFLSLLPEPYRSEFAGYLQSYMETGEEHVIGQTRELVGQRRDGTLFPIELSVSRIEIKGQLMFTGIVRDITERQKMDRMKSEFVSTVSHELRTPLTSIRGSLGLIAGGAVGDLPAKMRQLIDIAYSNSERLIRLINDILDIEKIESGKIVVNMQTHALMPLIEQALAANKGYAEQHGVRFVLAQRLDAAMVNVDADRLMQVMANLLSNAAKFSPPNAAVSIHVSAVDNRVRIAVTDSGPGVPESFQGKIFQKFTQADASDTRQKGGTGLGLAISKILVERMHGSIDFESTPNQGSTFFFELPVRLGTAEQSTADNHA